MRDRPAPSAGATPAVVASEGADLAERRRRIRARMHQAVIDSAMRASRREILRMFRRRLRTDDTALVAGDFLALADLATVHTALVIAGQGVGRAAACELRVHDQDSGALRIVGHRGLPPWFTRHLDGTGAEDAVTLANAMASAAGEPVLIDDIRTSPIFAGQPVLGLLVAVGVRALHAYPLQDDHGRALGVLSLYYRTAGHRPGQEPLMVSARQALAHVTTGPPGPTAGPSPPSSPPAARTEDRSVDSRDGEPPAGPDVVGGIEQLRAATPSVSPSPRRTGPP